MFLVSPVKKYINSQILHLDVSNLKKHKEHKDEVITRYCESQQVNNKT